MTSGQSVLPWDDVWGVVDAMAWVMCDDKVLHPRGVHLLIQDRQTDTSCQAVRPVVSP